MVELSAQPTTEPPIVLATRNDEQANRTTSTKASAGVRGEQPRQLRTRCAPGVWPSA
jgi:hypothetical protein